MILHFERNRFDYVTKDPELLPRVLATHKNCETERCESTAEATGPVFANLDSPAPLYQSCSHGITLYRTAKEF